jgi:hypothetical protein
MPLPLTQLPPPTMKTIIKREITLTLDESEAGQLRDLMVNCPGLWNNDREITANYTHTVLPELWRELNRLP